MCPPALDAVGDRDPVRGGDLLFPGRADRPVAPGQHRFPAVGQIANLSRTTPDRLAICPTIKNGLPREYPFYLSCLRDARPPRRAGRRVALPALRSPAPAGR